MRHREKIFLTGQRRCTVPMLALALLAVTGIGGCEWDSALYEEYVDTDYVNPETEKKEDHVESCPNLIEIVISDTESYKEDSGRYQDAFTHKICPKGFSCQETQCVKAQKGSCPANKHQNEKGVCVNDDIENCGAHKKDCNDELWAISGKVKCINARCVPNDKDSCASGYEFIEGSNEGKHTCKALDCPEGTHVYIDPNSEKKICEPDDVDNCGSHGSQCIVTVPGWVSGECPRGACIATECDADAGYDLQDGKCNAACIGSQVKCGGLCRDPLTDNEYCGATGTIISCESEGTTCGEGEVCVGGKCLKNSCKGDNPDLCEITYEDGTKKNECRNVKVDDVDHCGACNYVCANNPANHATSNTCIAGVCQYTCDSGYTLCSGDKVSADSIICIKDSDFQSDGNNCGGCGITCKAGEACANGKCVQNSCSGANPDLCVVDGKNVCKNTKSDDSDHCGACNYACANNPATNASSNTCKDGVCQYTCDNGYTNCGGVTAASIRCVKTTDMQTDGQNCGACGKVCGAEEACVGGKCVQNSCSGANPDLCVVDGKNVCKNTKSNDAEHCGACNYACANNPATNASSNACKAGVCQYTCNSGYTNCGGVTAASINCIKTTDLQTDGQNCGSCGTICGAGKACVGGKCVQNSCSGNTPDLCVVGGQNTCKKVNGNDANHCGACNYACSNNPATHATSNTCTAGVCQYTCDNGYTNCGGVTAASINCIKTTDLQTDGQNCGSCGNICGAGKACVGGKCVQNSCSGNTPDLCVVGGQNVCKKVSGNDAAHCGACNYSCANNPATHATSNTCANGVCQYTCDSGYTNCGGATAASINCIKTTDLQTDGQNCGSCGNVCGAGKACVGGTCVQNSCSGATPDLCVVGGQNTCKKVNGNDAAHCGACNYACSNNPANNATSNTCLNGVCQYTCNSGYTNCGGNTAASINCIKTTDLQTDGQNCGSCGNVCGAGKACVGGTCVQNSCSGATPDLCVVGGQNTCKKVDGNDAAHCGACNYACSNNPVANATSNTCAAGVCQYTCNSGYTNCGGATAASINCIKTTDLQTDGQNCGSCGNICGAGKACVGGQCVTNSCSGNTPDLCVVDSKNVCKKISGTDASHCGACNYACSNNPVANATSNTCAAGVCQYTCNSGYTNCGGATAASINCIKTTDLQTDGQNCGECGNICGAGKACVGGQCVTNSCSGNTPDLCVVNGKNVCKKVSGTDASHCGACNYACSNNPVANATSNTCTAGVCQYTCNNGYTNCGGATAASINCIKTSDLQTDGQNCGECGNICGAGKACVGGQCVTNSCSGNTPNLCVVDGKNVCKKVNGTDASHCGACNYACSNNPVANATSNTCAAGVCQYTCNSGYTNCGGNTAASINCIKTTDLQTDGQNCGSCGNICGAGKACVGGQCVQNSCDGNTPDLCVVDGQNVCKKVNGTDASHCGACNYACSNNKPLHSKVKAQNGCVNGVCKYECDSGYTNCGGDEATSISCILTTNLQNDSNNCGSCGNVCEIGTACVGGTCITSSCKSPTPDLCVVNGDNVCKNISGSDVNHCGACNYACSSNKPLHSKVKAQNGCVNGVCKYECDSGYTNCGGDEATSISCILTANLQNDSNNCGSCGNVCEVGTACVGGTCITSSCKSPTPDLCVVDGNNVCKNITGSDTSHCGACNYACSGNKPLHSKVKAQNGCVNGVCKYECDNDYTNCGGGDTAASISCILTSNLQNDPNNCGTCGNKCGAGEACISGNCRTISDCPNGQSLCNNPENALVHNQCFSSAILSALNRNADCTCKNNYHENNESVSCDPDSNP